MRWLIAVVAACGSDSAPDIPVFGPPTETACPPGGTTLRYETFAKPFMETYCTSCHASTLEGEARHGAPTFHDFDTYFGIRGVANHVDETSAAGPAAINRGMPQDNPRPSDEERFMLGEWIACDLPED